MRLAVIVPVLDEATVIESTLASLAPARARGTRLIVVDGGSTDSTIERAQPLADRILKSPRGRAQQMNVGARAALEDDADVLLFLHADCQLPDDADRMVRSALQSSGCAWGRFDVRIETHRWLLKIVSTMMNFRSRLTGICTGDQAIFVIRSAFETLGGFAPIPLMEDIEFSKRAGKISPPVAIGTRVRTSARRWQTYGVWRTILMMWRFRLAYFFGADPHQLAQRYRDAR
ncbi:MAG: TIGR04283 family arsenosugar biosynthesis glycosyltransferase [Burkholderiaceae bacterium]